MFHIQLETPAEGATVDPLCVRIEGWLYLGSRHGELATLEAHTSTGKIGETSLLFTRQDVTKSLQIPESERVGFLLLAGDFDAKPHSPLTLSLRARFRDGTTLELLSRDLETVSTDYRTMPYGVILGPDQTKLFHRENIYGSGPSVGEASTEGMEMVTRFLGPPPLRVLDIGCGIGAYGKPLLAAGYDWFGVEVKDSDCDELSRLKLPHARIDGTGLPFDDRSFDAVIAIEVLEHIEDIDGFLREARRVAPRLLLSVPNIELIPYLSRHLAVPWHILEADHKNFFTRWTLAETVRRHFRKVEVFNYGKAPLRTVEQTRLDFHLFAVAGD